MNDIVQITGTEVAVGSPLDGLLSRIQEATDLKAVSTVISELLDMHVDTEMILEDEGKQLELPESEIDKVRQVGIAAYEKYADIGPGLYSSSVADEIMNCVAGFDVHGDVLEAISNSENVIRMIREEGENDPYFLEFLESYWGKDEIAEKGLAPAAIRLVGAFVDNVHSAHVDNGSVPYNDGVLWPLTKFEEYLSDDARSKLEEAASENSFFMRSIALLHMSQTAQEGAAVPKEEIEKFLSENFNKIDEREHLERLSSVWGTAEIGDSAAEYGAVLMRFAPEDRQEEVAKNYIFAIAYASKSGWGPSNQAMGRFMDALEDLDIQPPPDFKEVLLLEG